MSEHDIAISTWLMDAFAAVRDLNKRLIALELGQSAIGVQDAHLWALTPSVFPDEGLPNMLNDLNVRLTHVEGTGTDPGPAFGYESHLELVNDSTLYHALQSISERILAADPIKHQ